MKIISGALLLLFSAMFCAEAHTPVMVCYNNGDNTITCEGGFSDGSSASGVRISVISDSGKTLLRGEMNENAVFTFPVPRGKFKILFDAGQGHKVEIRGAEIGS
jgi:hypothetical protein